VICSATMIPLVLFSFARFCRIHPMYLSNCPKADSSALHSVAVKDTQRGR
jgi:hypothetical protein